MRDRVHCQEMDRNLSAEEEAMLNDIGHDAGCACDDCRPDLSEALVACEEAA